jgi:hypothetical protein
VEFAAPFIVMPSANDALRGETKTFESCDAFANCPQSAKENPFVASTIPRSVGVSARGSAVSAGEGVDVRAASGDVLPAQAAALRSATAKRLRLLNGDIRVS